MCVMHVTVHVPFRRFEVLTLLVPIRTHTSCYSQTICGNIQNRNTNVLIKTTWKTELNWNFMGVIVRFDHINKPICVYSEHYLREPAGERGRER